MKTGDKFKAEIKGIPVEGKIYVVGKERIYLCQDKMVGSESPDLLGYSHSWVCHPNKLSYYNVNGLRIISEDPKSYKDWQVGDKIANREGDTGEIIFRSGKLVVFEDDNAASNNFTCDELYDNGWRLAVEEEKPTRLTIKDIAKLAGVDPSMVEIVD